MKIAGIIAEYNPFHNGHALHVSETRRATDCDYVVACMGGHFTQRGEPAMFSKWARTRMALSCGVDAVFELPALFAVRTADAFARGGIAILGGLGIDALSFGSEISDIARLRRIAEISNNEPTSVSDSIQQKLRTGKSYARARGEAVAEHLGIAPELLNQPNAILAVEYVRSIDALFPNVRCVAVVRRGGYHDPATGEYASASAIRGAFARGDHQAALQAMPEPIHPLAAPDLLHDMDDILMYALRNMSLAEMRALPDVAEGLEWRLHRLCRETATRGELMESLKCKRYTWARLSRLLTHAIIGMTSSLIESCPLPRYARLLGMRAGAEPLLRELNARTGIPIVSSAAQLRGDAVFELECRATDVWALLHDAPGERLPGREFSEKFVKV